LHLGLFSGSKISARRDFDVFEHGITSDSIGERGKNPQTRYGCRPHPVRFSACSAQKMNHTMKTHSQKNLSMFYGVKTPLDSDEELFFSAIRSLKTLIDFTRQMTTKK
jgi:hypothetical protein